MGYLADSRDWTQKEQHESGKYFYAPKARRYSKNDEDISKGLRSQSEWIPNGNIGDNRGIEVNDNNRLELIE